MLRSLAAASIATIALAAAPLSASSGKPEKVDREYVTAANAPAFQTWEQADAKSAGCVTCHSATDRKTMHANPAVVLGCTDCHGGDAGVHGPAGAREGVEYRSALERAHVLPRYPSKWESSANPERSYAWLMQESPEFVRFINPGDLRIAREACGACHLPIIQANEKSLMANAAMFWGAAAYNNGILPFKHSILGEAYDRDGKPAAV